MLGYIQSLILLF